MHIVTHYTMEAGVRTLERQIGAVCRGKAVEYAEARDAVVDSTPRLPETDSATPKPGDLPTLPKGYEPRVDIADIERLLGPATNEPDPRDLQTRVGVAAGLAYRSSGNGCVRPDLIGADSSVACSTSRRPRSRSRAPASSGRAARSATSSPRARSLRSSPLAETR